MLDEFLLNFINGVVNSYMYIYICFFIYVICKYHKESLFSGGQESLVATVYSVL